MASCVKHKLGYLIQISPLIYRQDFCLGESAGGKMNLWPGYTKDLERLLEAGHVSVTE